MATEAGRIPGFTAIIPAGGVGSRLWPLSRSDVPKFLLDLAGNGQSLLANTWDRLLPLADPENIMLVVGRNHRAAVEKELPELREANLIIENDQRESAVAICLAAAIAMKSDPEVIIGSFPADHVIRNDELFHHAVREAVATAATGKIVTIGIQPNEPATGFGYIKAGAQQPLPGAPDALAVESFIEKPNLETAKEYLFSGSYYWNAGIFVAKASVLLSALANSEPELYAAIEQLAAAFGTQEWISVRDELWPQIKKIAIDYAVAEPAAAAGLMAVIPGRFLWTDIGDFASLAKLHGGISDLVVIGDKAQVLSQDSSGFVVPQAGKMVTLIGVSDLVVVDTPDVLLVTTKEHAQSVKNIVEKVRLLGNNEVL